MTELAVRDDSAVATPAPHLPVPAMNDIDSWTEIVGKVIRLANEIYDTPFIPDGLRGSAAAVAAAILAGREMGLGPMTSLANIDVIRGKPTQKPLLMRAMILSRGHKWEDVENNDTRAVVRGCRKGESAWTQVTFTADQARKAGLDLGKYPADKLYARASSRLAKHRFADVIMGMASADDAEDGVDLEVDTATGEIARAKQEAGAVAIEAARPKTAQRASRRPTASVPAGGSAQEPQKPPAPAPAGEKTAPPGGPSLPPLPGEDEPGPPDERDYDSPGTISPQQRTKLWATLNGTFGYTRNDKDAARDAVAGIIGHDLDTSNNLSRNEASLVLDTLACCEHVATSRGGEPRAILDGILNDPRGVALVEFQRLGYSGTGITDTAGAVLRVPPPASLESLTGGQATRLAATLAGCRDKDALDTLLATGEVPGDGQ